MEIDLDATPTIHEELSREEWGIFEHIKGGSFEWDPNRISLYEWNGYQRNLWMKGTDIRREVSVKDPCNSNVLDFLLTNPELIPEAWKNVAVTFWGTIYHNHFGLWSVRELCWSGIRYRDHYRELSQHWSAGEPAAVFTR